MFQHDKLSMALAANPNYPAQEAKDTFPFSAARKNADTRAPRKASTSSVPQRETASTPSAGARIPKTPESGQEAITSGKKRILIVDDSLSVRMALRSILAESGYSVTACDSLASARSALSAMQFSLIILDLMLPDGTGIDFATELRGSSITAKVPVIMISGASDVWARIRGLRAGVDECIQKPWDDAYLITRVGSLIAARAPSVSGERPHSEMPATPPTPGVETRSPRVLVVEENITYWRRLSASLGVHGFTAVHAPTAERALELLLEERFDGVMACTQTPSMGGIRMCKRIRAGWGAREIPVLLMTTPGTFVEMRDAGKAAGATQVVVKNADVESVVVAMHDLLRKRGMPARALP